MGFKDYYLKEATGETATKMENAIADYYKTGKPSTMKGVTPEMNASAERICKAMQKQHKDLFGVIGKVGVKHLGSGRFECTPIWAKHDIKKSLPKTDIIINSERLSLKMGSSQLTSEAKAGQLALFDACSQLYDNEFDDGMTKVVNRYMKDIEKKFLNVRAETPIEVKKAREEAQQVIKDMQKGLDEIFNNINFKKIYIKETMGGKMKFGDDTEARAEKILAFTESGSETKIDVIDEDSYVAKIVDRVKARVSFKPHSIKSKGVKTGGSTIDNVIRAGLPEEKKKKEKLEESVGYSKLELFINEEFKIMENQINLISEGWFSDTKDKVISIGKAIASTVMGFFKKVFTVLKDAIAKGVDFFLDLLGLEGAVEIPGQQVSFL